MAGKDWNNLGQDLNRIIEDAVHMGNFGHLNDNINKTLRKAFQGFDGRQSGFGGSGEWDFKLSRDEPQQSTGQYSYGKVHTGQPFSAKAQAGQPGGTASGKYFAGSGKRRGGAIGMLAAGIVLLLLSTIPLGASVFGALIDAYSAGTTFLGIFAVFAIGGATLTVKGSSGLKLAGRFDKYVRCLNGKNYGDIKMLAAYTHRPEEQVLKDVRKMMHKGWFIQGHLDHQQKCLMVSDEAYTQYLSTVQNARLQAEEKRRKQEEEAKRSGGLTPEARAVIDKGREYITSIRRSNDAIPGEEVSEKIYRMELLVKRIFEQAEAHPENISDLRKLMDYYLPMTMKLLKAYEELDQQPVQGENIENSKREIEATLDTLNVAFEKLLDNLFQDRAWDVSSDISVLETMLAQEGLTEDGLGKK